MGQVIPIITAIATVASTASTVKSLIDKPKKPSPPALAATADREIDKERAATNAERNRLIRLKRLRANQRRKAVNTLFVNGQLGFPGTGGQSGSTLGTG